MVCSYVHRGSFKGSPLSTLSVQLSEYPSLLEKSPSCHSISFLKSMAKVSGVFGELLVALY